MSGNMPWCTAAPSVADWGRLRWLSMPAIARATRLRRELRDTTRRRPVPENRETRATLAVFRTIADSRTRYGPRAIGPYIISMTEGVDDVLSVLLLARWGGLVAGSDGPAKSGNGPATGNRAIPLDVAPLFETIDDLEAAPGVMRELFADPIYRRHVKKRGDRQTVMIGYSDSNKDSGLAAARWALQRVQEDLVRVARAARIDLTIFHGRGGTISRGGGKTHNAVLAAPIGAVDGHLRVTEQGEMIHAKYGLRGIAMRTLEQTTSAVMLASAGGRPSKAPPASWREAIDLVAGGQPRDLPEPGLRTESVRRILPARHADRRHRANADRVPPRGAAHERRCRGSARHPLGVRLDPVAPASAGVVRPRLGAAGGGAPSWRGASRLHDPALAVHARSDRRRRNGPRQDRHGDRRALCATGARFAAGDFFADIRREYERTRRIILRLKGTRALLDGDRTLQRSIRLRNPYVDPMSLLQVDLLRRWRRSGRRDRGLLGALLTTVNGIAHGLRNTG